MLSILRTGDMIAFKKSTNFFSKIVHFFTKSDVNHVAIVVRLYNRNGKGFPFIIEANEDGVEYHYLPTVLKTTNSKLYAYKLSDKNIQLLDKNLETFYNYANKQIGKEYSVPDAIETIIDKVFDKTVKKDNFSRFICSILVGALYQHVNIINPYMLKAFNFQCVSELTPIDCCNLPLFNEIVYLSEDYKNEKRTTVNC